MKASKLRTLWIILISTVIVMHSSLRVIFMCLFKTSTRERIDQECRRWARRLLKAVKVNYEVNNPQHIDITQYPCCMLMVNHSSHYDIPLCFAALSGSIRMLAKQELGRIPLFGKAMRMAEFPLVDRQNTRQAIIDLAKAQKLMQDGVIIWIAPEGTRSPTGKLQRFKKGGFKLAVNAQATIIPIGICGAHKILPKNTIQFNLHQNVTINIGKPVNASQYTTENIDQLMTGVAEQIQELLQGSTQHS